MSFSNLLSFRYFKKHPDKLKETNIEFKDERNIMIRNMAKAKVADIIQWFIIGLAYLSILLGEPLWVTLIIIGVFLLKFIMEVYLMSVYQRKL